MIYAYVTCHPDIGYAITTLSKFSSKPHVIHYAYLKWVAKYLRTTKHWGIRFKRSVLRPELPPGTYDDRLDLPNSLSFPTDINKPELLCFVDAAYANDLRKRRSTTGFCFTFCGGAIVYRSKTQGVNALSSTEAEFIAACSAAKIALYIRSLLKELGYPPRGPTRIYEDNASTIKIVNARVPTERTRHIDIRFFAIQTWKEDNLILLTHIKGILNPSDDLTKPLGWVLHSRHARRLMGHYRH